MYKNGHNAKAIAHAKYLVWVKKWNCLKHAKNVSTNTLKLCYAKSGCKKQLIYKKWEHFKNAQKWPLCKGYSPCKILSLCQKIKLPKIFRKRVYKLIKGVLCKKRLQKELIFEKWEHFENGKKWPQCKGYGPCKILSLCQKIKLPRRCEIRF